MKIQSPKKLIAEDFAPEDRPIIERIGATINNYLDELNIAMSKNINITDNLNQELKILNNVSIINANGDLANPLKIKHGLKTRVNGIIVIRAIGSVFADSQPFMSFSEQDNIITVENIKGLPANQQFQLVILIIGN